MDVLVPIDGSDCSFRALEFAVDFAERYDAVCHVVHVTDAVTDATDTLLAQAHEKLDSLDSSADVELDVVDTLEMRAAKEVGKEILRLVEREGYDHVVMGHHGGGTVERAILGSAAETVVRGETVPVTVVP
jgi:nucleotide-binding universal stress UspA family protein